MNLLDEHIDTLNPPHPSLIFICTILTASQTLPSIVRFKSLLETFSGTIPHLLEVSQGPEYPGLLPSGWAASWPTQLSSRALPSPSSRDSHHINFMSHLLSSISCVHLFPGLSPHLVKHNLQ